MPVHVLGGASTDQKVKVYLKKEVKLSCQAIGDPAAIVTWKKDKKAVKGVIFTLYFLVNKKVTCLNVRLTPCWNHKRTRVRVMDHNTHALQTLRRGVAPF